MPLPTGHESAPKPKAYHSVSVPTLYITRIDDLIRSRLPGRSRTDVVMRAVDRLEEKFREWDRGP